MTNEEKILSMLEALTATVADMKQDFGQRLDKLDSKVDKLESKVDKLESKVDQLEAGQAAMQVDITVLKKGQDYLTAGVDKTLETALLIDEFNEKHHKEMNVKLDEFKVVTMANTYDISVLKHKAMCSVGV